jgi:ribosomal protein L24
MTGDLFAFRPHQTVKVLTGKYAGLVGTVRAVSAKRVQVDISGIKDGECVQVSTWYAASSLKVTA